MKKVSRISLHNLSKDELANNEMNLLRGSSGMLCNCICISTTCRCTDEDSGTFYPSAGVLVAHSDDSADNQSFQKTHMDN